MTYLFDQQKAMDILAPLEQQWGGTLAERTARRAARFEAAAKAGTAA
jgi:penicillin-binding protein 2